MNLRKETTLDLITNHLSTIDIDNSSLLVFRYDQTSTDPKLIEHLAREILKALKIINKEKPILLIPFKSNLEQIPEIEMNKMGWFRR